MIEFNGRIGHLENIESPWGNAGGVVKTIEDVEKMAHTGVGWVEAGSFTLEPRVGNSPNGETVYCHNPETGETFNSLGMPNKGMDIIEIEIPEMARIAHAQNKPLVVNVAPVSENPSTESVELVRRAYAAGADAVLLNAGCPNVVTMDGGRHELLSRSPDNLARVLFDIGSVIDKPIFLRISPQVSSANMSRVISAIRLSKAVSAVSAPNTWPNHKPLTGYGEEILQVSGGIGGKSGPAMEHEAMKETNWAVRHAQGEVDIISSSSIMSARSLQRRLSLGAVAGAGTTFFYEPVNGWQEDVDRMLTELAS